MECGQQTWRRWSNVNRLGGDGVLSADLEEMEYCQQTWEGLVLGTKVQRNQKSLEVPTPEVNTELLSKRPREETHREQVSPGVRRTQQMAWEGEELHSWEQHRDAVAQNSAHDRGLTGWPEEWVVIVWEFFKSKNRKSFCKRRRQEQQQQLGATNQHTAGCLPLCFWRPRISLAVSVKGFLPSSKLSVQW